MSKGKGKKLVYIKTFGCSLNQSDSEVMSGLLVNAGFDVISVGGGELTHSNDIALLKNRIVDVVIINSCTVKNLAESKFFRELKYWQATTVKVIVAGCIPQAEPLMLSNELKSVSVMGTRQIIKVVDIVNAMLDGRVIHDIANDKNERLNLPKIRKSGIIEILPISEGCMSKCTYCKTKFARGDLLSYPKEKILSQFKSALEDGCKEFWITSQDNGCYGFDIYRKEKYFLPQLLDDLLILGDKSGIDFRIRLGMSNPDHVDIIKQDLVKTFIHPKMFKFLHIPVQAGNDKVLTDMKRKYTIEKFKRIIKLFRSNVPDITISTDIIVGFPGESDAEFNDTLKLIRDVEFDVVNLSRFWSRKGTAAEKMKPVYSGVMISRSKKAKQLFEDIIKVNNHKLLGETFTVLIDELVVDEFGTDSKTDSIIARTDSYKQVFIKDTSVGTLKRISLGQFLNVKIIGTTKYSLIGERVSGFYRR